MIRAVVFDIGQTLVHYPLPLNWSALYRPAFEKVSADLGLEFTDDEYEHFGEVLRRYNARINPREIEVSSDVIFGEIIEGTSISPDMKTAVKEGFYSFFRRDTYQYPEAEEVLIKLHDKGIVTATLSDVAYGMDNRYALEDIGTLLDHIDYPWTSNDAGFRKPSPKALLKLASSMDIDVSQMAFVGDEKKDIECCNAAGAMSVLVNRTDEVREYGQDWTISDLRGILELIV